LRCIRGRRPVLFISHPFASMQTCAMNCYWYGCQCPVVHSGGERECTSHAGCCSEHRGHEALAAETRRRSVDGRVCLRNGPRPGDSRSHLSGSPSVNVGLAPPAWQWSLGGELVVADPSPSGSFYSPGFRTRRARLLPPPSRSQPVRPRAGASGMTVHWHLKFRPA
jgi:hypothetical protein